ncbi:hypothetical protein [Limnohabitans sp. DM1]|uniref:hypothetical protein n=1 Tax=Limnohabitans sp. DM1 TaxID=1597955 RepID=UPI001892A8C5|nr:hypothetical protein [Limnohabitans sp. DM1]
MATDPRQRPPHSVVSTSLEGAFSLTKLALRPKRGAMNVMNLSIAHRPAKAPDLVFSCFENKLKKIRQKSALNTPIGYFVMSLLTITSWLVDTNAKKELLNESDHFFEFELGFHKSVEI